MTRALPEWIGRTPDSAIPSRVQDRVIQRAEGKCQCGCGRPFFPGSKIEIDHTRAIANGGENRENNLRAVLADCHKIKTRADVAEKAKTYARRAKHVGIKRSKRPFRGWRNDFTGEVVVNPKAARRRTP